jgi:predicted nucleotidyltransferase
MPEKADVLQNFREDVLEALKSNLICLLHHGSRAKGEARPNSDYDSVVITKKINKEVITSLQSVSLKYPEFSLYLLSFDELKTMPRGHCLEFLYAKPLYGSIDLELPTKEETVNYIAHKRRDTLDMIRHMLTLPHSTERKMRLVYYSLKDAYICLSYLAFSEEGKLPPTRKETITYLRKKKKQNLGIRLLRILDRWDSHKEDVANTPDAYLYLLEEFFRKLRLASCQMPKFGRRKVLLHTR